MLGLNLYNNIDEVVSYTIFFYVCIIVALSSLWNVYFIKRILYFVPLYRECIEEAKTDILGNSSELALHYKTEIIKYIFLLSINITENCTVLLNGIGIGVTWIKTNNSTVNCTSGSVHNIDSAVIVGNPFAAIFLSIGEAGFTLSLALVICLLKYLDVKYHNPNREPSQFIKYFLSVSCLIGVLLIVTGSIPQLIIFQKLFEPIIQLAYFSIWVKQSRSFYKTLKWRSLELKVRGRSCQMIRRSVKSRCHFGVIMSLMGIGIICLISCKLMDGGTFLFMTIVRYPCLFHKLYGTPASSTLLSTNVQIEILNICYEAIGYLILALVLVASSTTILQYVFATIVFFGGMLIKSLKYRFGRVRTRFTPSLTDQLLIQH